MVAMTALFLVGCGSSSEQSSSTTTTIATSTTTAVAAVVTPAPEAALVAAITDRLALAVDVARTKWSSGAAIEDLDREAQAVAAIEAAAPGLGVDPAVAAAALRAQIEASKTVQRALHQAWEADGQPPFAEVRELADIRTELDQATNAMLAALATVELPVPPPRIEEHTAAMAGRLSDVPDPGQAIAEALAPFA